MSRTAGGTPPAPGRLTVLFLRSGLKPRNDRESRRYSSGEVDQEHSVFRGLPRPRRGGAYLCGGGKREPQFGRPVLRVDHEWLRGHSHISGAPRIVGASCRPNLVLQRSAFRIVERERHLSLAVGT